MLPTDDKEEDGADGEDEEEEGEDDDGDEVGVEGGVVHGGGDDGGDGEGRLEEGEIAQRSLSVFQTALDLASEIVKDILLINIPQNFIFIIILLITFLRISRPTAVSVIIGLK